MLADSSAAGKEVAYTVVTRGTKLGKGIRSNRLHYTLWPDGSEELYDLVKDPAKENNLAVSKPHAEAIGSMREHLEHAESVAWSRQRPTSHQQESTMQKLSLTLITFLLTCWPANADAQLIVAHRGASHDAPENTLAAFQLAWEQDADAIEGDFHVTSDNQIVCIHDKTTKRVAPKRRALTVAESTFQELRTFDVGSWKDPRYSAERIPTLREVLATVPDGKQILVEVKCGPEILPLLKPQLETSGLKPEQIVIICFKKDVISESRKMMPNYKANWLTSYKQTAGQSQWKPTRDEVVIALQQTRATGLGTNGNLNVVDRAFVSAVRNSGSEFHVWTVNDVNTARKFSDLGAESITTDRPAFIRNAIEPEPALRP